MSDFCDFMEVSGKNIKGYGLLETIVGVAVLSVGILSILSVSTRLITAQDYVRHRESAIFLSQEGFETVKTRLEDNFNKCSVDLGSLIYIWNCWGTVTATSNSCDCEGGPDIFLDTEGYKADFDGADWSVSPVALNSWEPLFYNCPATESFCYYSHAFLGADSTATIYQRKISVEDREDYNADTYDDMIRISSAVRWVEKGDYKYVTTTSEFYNWRWRKSK